MRRLTSTMLIAALLAPIAASAQANNIDQQMRDDASGLSAFSANSATVKRLPDNACFGFEPFKFMACGPMVTISLNLMPGMYGSLEYSTTQGGDLAQVMNALSGMADATEGDTLNDLARQADAVDGSSITISIPLIDYGYTGTFNNASISMNRANSDEHGSIYQAIGPRDAARGADKQFPLSGTVTIEEYSLTVLRGSFTGQMVDLAQADMSADDPILPVIHQLSGTFNVIAPWRGDDRAVIRSAEEIASGVRQDVGQAFPAATSADRENNPDQDFTDADEQRIFGSISGSTPACDCSCNNVGSTTPACQQSCSATFEACKGEPVPGLSDEDLQEAGQMAVKAGDAGAQLRLDFLELVEEKYGQMENYEQQKELLLKSFDEQPDLAGKATVYGSQGGKKWCPPPEGLKEELGMFPLMFCH